MGTRQSFEREFNVWANLTHPHILPFFGTVTDVGPSICLVRARPHSGFHVLYSRLGRSPPGKRMATSYGALNESPYIIILL